MAVNRLLRPELLVGLAVVVVVGVLIYFETRPSWEPIRIEEVSGSSASSTLAVEVTHSLCDDGPPTRVRAVEQTDRTIVLLAEQDASGECDDMGVHAGLSLELKEQLGERTIRLDNQAPLEPDACVIDEVPSERREGDS